MQNKGQFVGSLGLSGPIVDPWMKLYDMGHCRPYEIIKIVLSEWIVNKKDSATIGELRRILQQENFQRCSRNLKKLQEMHPGVITIPGLETSRKNDPFGISPQPHSSGTSPPMDTPKSRPVKFGLKSVVQNFTGREEELARLNEHFHSRECPIVLLSGLGGIGKTELAKKFALDISDGQIVKCWLSGENSQSLLNSIAKFCDQLQLPSKGADGQPLQIQEMIQNIMKKLKSSEEFGRLVVIIDNVDDIHSEFDTALKTLSDFGSDAFLVVTSRRRDIYEGDVELLEVKEMQLENSMEFVRKSLKITDNSSDDPISSLCEILGNFPLALNQASAFIRQQQSGTLKGKAYKIENYLEELARTETLGLDKDRKLGYSTATLKVWNITINKIRECYETNGQIALDLLDSMAFINPDNIPIPFLYKLYQRFYNMQEIAMNQIKASLTILLNYSLISSYDELLNIHRLVQLSSRDRMSTKSPAENGECSKDIHMLRKFWTSFDSKKWNQIEMRNILTIWSHTAKHEELNAHRADKILDVQAQLHALGMVNESYDFSIEGGKFVREHYQPDDVEYSAMEFSLALALKEKGQYESALQKYTYLHSKFEGLFGTENRLTVAVANGIASVLCNLERFEESLEWAQRILQFQIRINNGEHNENVMMAKGLVAMALENLGRIAEAKGIHFEILEWREANLAANHPSILAAKHAIATCFFEEGMFTDVLAISQEMLPHHEEILGSDHPHTLATKTLLAETLAKMGKIDIALKISEEVLVAREKVLGAEHLHTINVRKRVTLFKNKIKQEAPKI